VDGLWAPKSDGVGLSVRAIVSMISNLCDPDPPTSQTDRHTDRQTDRQTTYAIAIPRFALKCIAR